MDSWHQYLLVGGGGAVGSIARWQLASAVTQHWAQPKFPLGTFAVNVLGCLVIGALAGYAAKYGAFATNTRLLLFTGLMGGFTTFSAFGLETFALLKSGDLTLAALNVLLSVVMGLVGLALGYFLVSGQLN